MTLEYDFALHEFSVAQRIQCPPGVWENIGSNPIGDSDFSLPHARDMLIISFSHKLEVVVTEILWKLEVRFETELRKIQKNPDRRPPHYSSHFSLLRRGFFCVVASEAGEKEIESARGTVGRRKTEERLRVRASAFYFSIIDIFVGKLSQSLCGGKSSHFGWLDLIGLNICNKSTWGS